MKKNISTADKIVRYQAPLVEVFTISSEGSVCTGSPSGTFSSFGGDTNAADDYWGTNN